MTELNIIDSHVHLWDVDALEYSWHEDVAPLARTFGVPDFRAATGDDARVEGLVFVQAEANSAIDEARFIDALAASNPCVQGIVAQAPLELGKAASERISELLTLRRLKGIRRLIQGEAEDFHIQPAFIEGVRLLAQWDLSFDLCVVHPQLANTVELVRACPEVRFVLDHCGKPGIADGLMEPWRAEITSLAQLPNVHCKLSGLSTEANPQDWTEEQIRPYLDHVIESFGIDRVMFGSDWPVATLATDYRRWLDLVLAACAGFSQDEQQKIFADNAKAFYRLDTGHS